MDRRTRPLFSPKALGMYMLLAAAPCFSQAGDGCRTIHASVRAYVDQIVFMLGGIVDGDLRGSLQFAGDPPSDQILLPSLPNPTSSFTGDLRITTRQGVLHTRSAGLFESTFNGGGTTLERVVDGTGVYQGATGTLYLNFMINEDFSVLSGNLVGQLCLAASTPPAPSVP